MLDVAVIGAGPVGLAAAIAVQHAGLTVRVLERGTICNSIVGFPRDMTFFSIGPNIEIAGHPLTGRGPKPTRNEALLYYRRVAEVEALDVQTATEVRRIGRDDDGVFRLWLHGRHGERIEVARHVIVATGYFDNYTLLDVPGATLPHVHYRYVEPWPWQGERVVVIGGSNSAIESALDLHYRGGALVTLVHRNAELRPSVKYWLKPDFENRVKEGSIEAIYGAQVKEITPESVVVTTGAATREIAADVVLVQIGYHATDRLVREAGAQFEGGPEGNARPVLSTAFESSVPGLFVIGSAGFGDDTRTVFIENGREHAAKAAAEIVTRAGGGTTSEA